MNLWGKTKTGSKAGFDKLYGWVDKLGPPVNRLSNKLGAEAFWPTTLDKESDKAARILRSFCRDGFYQEEEHPTADGPTAKQKVLKKIPQEVIQNAKGLAIFTTMRTGLWFSGAGGSGVLVARLPDGSWSPPSGLMLHTAGVGFLVGVDIYDCVMVINTDEALQAFTRIRCTLGGEVSAVAGPVGVGGVYESEVHKRRAPIFTYLKSRGFYAGVQLDGTILIERTDENERFYRERIPGQDILAGKIRHPPYEVRTLMQTIKSAQGDSDVDETALPTEPSPSDFEIEDSSKTFGVPDKDDPDPYGVLALEKEGLQIREAGTRKRASVDQFNFNPVPSSPIYPAFNRMSMDGKTTSRRSSWRNSMVSTNATSMTDRSTQTTDMSTQTDFDSPVVSPSLSSRSPKMEDIQEETFVAQEHQPQPTLAKPGVDSHTSTDEQVSPLAQAAQTSPTITVEEYFPPAQKEEATLAGFREEILRPVTPPNPISPVDVDSDDEVEEAPVIHEVKKAASPKFVARARLVTVQKRVAPALPPRNPGRDRKPLVIDGAADESEDHAIEQITPPTSASHSRQSSESTYREPLSAHRSNSDASISSVEELSSLEKHVAAFKVENHKVEKIEEKSEEKSKHKLDGKTGVTEEKESEIFHSVPVTPAAEASNPIEAKG